MLKHQFLIPARINLQPIINSRSEILNCHSKVWILRVSKHLAPMTMRNPQVSWWAPSKVPRI